MNMNAATPGLTVPQHRLEHCPIAIFSTVMGVAGLAIAWLKAHAILGFLALLTVAVGALAVQTLIAVWRQGICTPEQTAESGVIFISPGTREVSPCN